MLALCAARCSPRQRSAPQAAPRAAAPVDVAIQTSLGTIVVRLDTARAPGTTANFLHYVDAGTYNGTTFYRTVSKANEPASKIEVIQGGLNPQAPNPMIRPIPLEPTSKTGLHNTDGTIAMARTSDPELRRRRSSSCASATTGSWTRAVRRGRATRRSAR